MLASRTYRVPGWPRNIAEVIVLFDLPKGSALCSGFMTPLGSRQTHECRKSLERLIPALNRILLRQFDVIPTRLDADNVTSVKEDRFHDVGCDVLTARESEIARLILIGQGGTSGSDIWRARGPSGRYGRHTGRKRQARRLVIGDRICLIVEAIDPKRNTVLRTNEDMKAQMHTAIDRLRDAAIGAA